MRWLHTCSSTANNARRHWRLLVSSARLDLVDSSGATHVARAAKAERRAGVVRRLRKVVHVDGRVVCALARRPAYCVCRGVAQRALEHVVREDRAERTAVIAATEAT
eukprot:6213034-Pleurochrysis_carterae.AAC.3